MKIYLIIDIDKSEKIENILSKCTDIDSAEMDKNYFDARYNIDTIIREEEQK